MLKGWFQIAFERDLANSITPASIGGLRLVMVRSGDSIRTFRADCPHRGADLARGRLEGESLVCPFHGYRVGLGKCTGEHFWTPEYTTLAVSGMVFVLIGQEHENGFTQAIKDLEASLYFAPGFSIKARVRPDLVIENAFDRRHFQAIHRIDQDLGLRIVPGPQGMLAVCGRMVTSSNAWQQSLSGQSVCTTGFLARIYSPNICIAELSIEDRALYFITAATPRLDGHCDIRLSVAVRPAAEATPPSDELFQALLHDSLRALREDIKVWESLSDDVVPSFTKDDDLVLEYHRFCDRFRA
jgi:phenylpropionate dioxygenase-like ring-hydroxylating dioxygenase large terminal subunit